MNANAQVVTYLAAHRTDAGVAFFSRITEFGGTAVVILVMLAAAFVLWYGKRWAHAIGLIVALGGAIATSEVLKFLVREARPDGTLRAVVETGYSFPSNHSAAALALYGFLAWSLWDIRAPLRSVGIAICFAMILLIGYSRVYLGVHYPLDVLGGFIVGMLFLWIGTRITKHLEHFGESSPSGVL